MDENIKRYEKENRKSECVVRNLTDEEMSKYNFEERRIMNKVLKIDEELRDLLPPLTDEELKKLEEQIKKDGCLDSIKTWNGFIADGHNRYNICNKNNIAFQVIELGFVNKDDVMEWMIETQLGRRNLSPIQRVQVAEKYRPIFKRKAEENKSNAISESNKNRKEDNPMWQKSSILENKIHVRDELSKIAKVSHDTYGKAKNIIDLEERANKGEEELTEKQKEIINKVKKDEIKVNTAYNELFDIPKVNKKKNLEIVKNDEIKKENIVESKPEVVENKPFVKNDVILADESIEGNKELNELGLWFKSKRSGYENLNVEHEIKAIEGTAKNVIQSLHWSIFENGIDLDKYLQKEHYEQIKIILEATKLEIENYITIMEDKINESK